MENKTYELELLPLKINNKSIELWTVKRWQGAVEAEYENEADYVHTFPLWIKVWEASIVLSEHLSQGIIQKDAEVLELGAGMGLTGLVLGATGYHVKMTDYTEDVLALLKKNVNHNKLENVYVKKLNWFQPDTEETYDTILGSELIYKKELIEPLLNLLQKYLKPDGTIFIAHDTRRQNMADFLKKMEVLFQIKSRVKTLKTDNKLYKVAIHSIRFK